MIVVLALSERPLRMVPLLISVLISVKSAFMFAIQSAVFPEPSEFNKFNNLVKSALHCAFTTGVVVATAAVLVPVAGTPDVCSKAAVVALAGTPLLLSATTGVEEATAVGLVTAAGEVWYAFAGAEEVLLTFFVSATDVEVEWTTDEEEAAGVLYAAGALLLEAACVAATLVELDEPYKIELTSFFRSSHLDTILGDGV